MVYKTMPLESCPNCNKDNVYLERLWSHLKSEFGYYVVCRECAMQGPMSLYESVAAELWNNLPREKSCRKHSCKPIQQNIFEAIKERGYLDQGLSLTETLARQLAKLAEELGELSEECYSLPGELYHILSLCKTIGKTVFDNVGSWEDSRLSYGKFAADELADIGVVLFCMAEIVNKLSQENIGEPFDLLDAVRKKAEQDTERGVRNEQ